MSTDQAPEWFDYESPEERRVWTMGLGWADNHPYWHAKGEGLVSDSFTSFNAARDARNWMLANMGAFITSDEGCVCESTFKGRLTKALSEGFAFYLLNESFEVELVIRP